MIFDWYKVLNRAEFEAEDLVSREVELFLEGIGTRTVLVTKGNALSIVYDDVMLSLGVTTANPFIFGGYAIYEDAVGGDIWLGIEVDED